MENNTTPSKLENNLSDPDSTSADICDTNQSLDEIPPHNQQAPDDDINELFNVTNSSISGDEHTETDNEDLLNSTTPELDAIQDTYINTADENQLYAYSSDETEIDDLLKDIPDNLYTDHQSTETDTNITETREESAPSDITEEEILDAINDEAEIDDLLKDIPDNLYTDHQSTETDPNETETWEASTPSDIIEGEIPDAINDEAEIDDLLKDILGDQYNIHQSTENSDNETEASEENHSSATDEEKNTNTMINDDAEIDDLLKDILGDQYNIHHPTESSDNETEASEENYSSATDEEKSTNTMINDDAEIDDLLKDILGDQYIIHQPAGTENTSSSDNAIQNKSNTTYNPSNEKTDIESLLKSILGDQYKEYSSPKNKKPILHHSQEKNVEDNPVEQNISKVEKLWSELSTSWPVIYTRPEIKSKIEELWNTLKNNNNINRQTLTYNQDNELAGKYSYKEPETSIDEINQIINEDTPLNNDKYRKTRNDLDSITGPDNTDNMNSQINTVDLPVHDSTLIDSITPAVKNYDLPVQTTPEPESSNIEITDNTLSQSTANEENNISKEIQTTQDQEQQTYSKYLDDKEYGSEDLVQSILDGTYKSNRTEGVNNDQIEQSDNNETLATSNEDASAIEYNSDKETEDKLFEPNSHTKENISKEEPIEPASNEKNIFDHINDFNQFLASEKTSNTDVDQLKQAPFTPIDKPDTRESDFTETNEFDEKTTPSTTPIPDLFTEETSITNDNQFKEESFTLTDKPDTGEHNFSEANEFNEKITPSITPIPVSSTEETSITNDDEFKKESFTLTGKPDTVLQDFTETNEFDEKITLSRTPIPDLSTTLEKSIPPANQSTGRIPPVKSKSYKTESILMLTAITIVVIIFIFSDINNKETTDNKTTNNLLRDQIHYQSSEKNNVLEKQTEELSKSSYRSNETNKKRENIYNPESSYSAHTILNKETKAQNNYETPPPAYFETSQEDEKSGESLNDKAGSSNTEPSVAQNDINQEVTTDKETAQTYLESQESSESARKEIDEIEPSMQVHTDVSPEEYSDTTQTYLESQASSASTRKKIHGIESSMQVNPDVSPAKYSDTDQSRTVTLSDAEKTYSGENTAIESSTPASHGMDTANYNSTIRTETDSLEHFVDSNIEIAEIEVINQFETEIDTTPTDEKNDAMHDKPAPHSIMHNSSLLQGKPYYWALNLSSIYNAKEPADEVIKSLRNKNIPAEIKQILIEKKVWYRIRIRGFENKQQAIDYMDIIKENTDIRKYWVSKITPGPDSDKPGNPSIMSQ